MRTDAVDGNAYTYAEYLEFYRNQYTQKEIDKAWEGLPLAPAQTRQKIEAKASASSDAAIAALVERQRHYIRKCHHALRCQSGLVARSDLPAISEREAHIRQAHQALHSLSCLVSDCERMWASEGAHRPCLLPPTGGPSPPPRTPIAPALTPCRPVSSF